MTDQSYRAVDLVELSKIDIAIGRIIAEGKTLDKSSVVAKEKLKKIAEKLKAHQDGTSRIRTDYNREASDLKFQQEKLINRRKALANLGSTKAQVAAEREVDATAKALEAREEKLLEVLLQLEEYDKNIKELEKAHGEAELELKQLIDGAKAHRELLAERRAEKDLERANKAAQIGRDFLSRYETVLRKYALDPIVPILNKTCSGCGITLVAQVLLKVTKSTAPVQCPGCSRILYIDDKAVSE